MTKLMRWLTALVLCAALLAGMPAAAAGAVVSVGSAQADAGGTVTVDVRITGGSGLTNFDLVISCAEGLELKDITAADGACASGLFAANPDTGVVTWASLSGAAGDCLLFRLTLRVSENAAPGGLEVSVGIKQGGAFGGDGSAMAVSFTPGHITVTGSASSGEAADGSTGSADGPTGGAKREPEPEITQPVERLEPVYSDVAADAWYAECVGALGAAGVVNGYPDGTFRPNGTVTRAEALKLILLAAGYDEQGTSAGRHWAAGYLDLAVSLGLENAAAPLDEGITRLEIARVIAGAAKLDTSGAKSPFDDCSDASVAALAEAGLVRGYGDGGFGPQRTISRAEMAMIIWRLYSYAETGSVPA